MALPVHNSKTLVDPANFHWKVLVFGLPGSGKTIWACGAPSPGVIACETGHGKGLLSAADLDVDYVEPKCLEDFEDVFSGRVFSEKKSIVLDTISYVSKTFVKDAALKLPRMKGDSPKRRIGIPELDDYGSMGVFTTRLLEKLLSLPKNVIVLATEKIKGGGDEGGDLMIGPDLPGASFEGAPAMFDTVLRLRTRPKLRDPKDAKSRYAERYFVTQPDGMSLSKGRNNIGGVSVLANEEVFDLTTGQGSFTYLHGKITAAYLKREEKKVG